MNHPNTLLAVFIAILISVPAHATFVESDEYQYGGGTESYYDELIDTTGDLVYDQPTTLVAGVAASGYTVGETLAPEGGTASHFVDGLASTGQLHQNNAIFLSDALVPNATLDADPTFTVQLNTTASPLGYTIFTIDTFYGFNNHASLSDQDYTLFYSTVLAPTVFIPFYTVSYNPINPSGDTNQQNNASASSVSLSGFTGITGVADIRMVLTPYFASETGGGTVEQSGQDIRELEVFGAAVPEPSTYAMMLGGLALLVLSKALRFAKSSRMTT